MKYLRMTKEQFEKIEKLLKEQGVEYESFFSPLDMFCNEEADFRINDLENTHGALTDKVRETILEDLADELYDNTEMFLDNDYICDVTHDTIKQHIPDYFNKKTA